jgi:hypothetical protein
VGNPYIYIEEESPSDLQVENIISGNVGTVQPVYANYIVEEFPSGLQVENIISGNVGTVQPVFADHYDPDSLYFPGPGMVPVLWDGEFRKYGICVVRQDMIRKANWQFLK